METTMRRWTTPTHELVVEGVDLTGCDVYVDYKQGSRTRRVKVEPSFDGTDTLLEVEWTQEQSAVFKPGDVEVQVNWIHPHGERDATEIVTLEATRNLLNEEVAFDG